jgi:hypothetical protein
VGEDAADTLEASWRREDFAGAVPRRRLTGRLPGLEIRVKDGEGKVGEEGNQNVPTLTCAAFAMQ